MRSRNPLPLVVVALFMATLSAHAQLTTYSDPKTGVTFQYPTVWLPSDKAPSYLGPSFTSDTAQLRASFTFAANSNLYKKTLLLSLVFSYFIAPTTDAASCLKLAQDASGVDLKPKPVVIHGVSYQEVDGSDAGMCHEQSNQIDLTYRDNQCFVFERDFNTECYGADDHKRQLTAAEMKALQHHLDAIMQSVVFAPIKP